MFEGDLGAALIGAAELHAERPALWAAGKRFTYAELIDQAVIIASGLQSAGLEPGERVAILAHRGLTLYAGILAVLLSGCTYAPLSARFSRERNQAMLNASGATALVVDDECVSRLDDLLDPLSANLIVAAPEKPELPHGVAGRLASSVQGAGAAFWHSVLRTVGRERPAYLLFTSGTTGTPKGVPISHANLDAYLTGISVIAPITEHDRVLQFVDVTFDLSVHDMFTAWLNGAELYSMPENAAMLLPRFIAQHGITSCLIVPSTGAFNVQQGLARPASMPSLRQSFFCGEALPRIVAASWQDAAPNSRVINLYGPTEATVAFSQYEYQPEIAGDFAVLPIGRPLGHKNMGLFRPDLTEAPAGESGEICLAGAQLTAGYWRNPSIDAEKFFVADGVRWYRTGDLGRYLEPHGYVFAGRADRQVKIRGALVELQEVEAVLRRVTGRQQIAVIPWPSVALGSFGGTVAFICGAETDVKDVRSQCRKLAGETMTPDRIVFVPELPVNSNGKVDYKVLASTLA